MAYVPIRALEAYNYHYEQAKRFLAAEGDVSKDALALEYIFICYTNRSGSNLLAEALASDGDLNLGQEFLNFDQIERCCHRVPNLRSIHDYFSGVAVNDACNGAFVAKVNIEHITILKCTGILDAILPRTKFIFTERGDKLGQAISYSIAEQTQIWSSYDAPKAESRKPVFEKERIDRLLDMILEQNELFERFFVGNGLTPIRVVYEHLVDMPGRTLKYLGEHIGRCVVYEPKVVHTSVQRDATNAAWRELYLTIVRGSDLSTAAPQ